MKMIMLLMLAAEPGAATAPDVQLLDFTASYCTPCQQMLPILQKMEQDKFPIRRIDITEEHELARRYQVDRVPTLVLLVEGKEIKRFVGITDGAELRSEMLRAARKLSAARREVAEQQADKAPATGSVSAGNKAEDTSRPEATPRSMVGIFKGLLGKDAQPTTFEYPKFRSQSPENSAPQLIGLRAAEAATVRVRVAGTSGKDGARVQDVGTGTIIHSATGQALILTCAHVFLNISLDDAVVDVEIFEGGKATRYPAELVGGDHNADLAILKLQTSKLLPSVRLTLLAPTSVKGQSLVSFGCNDGANPTRLDTKLVDTNRYDGPSNLVCSTDPKSGRSGGGLFNAAGELLGVCSCADRKRSEGLYMAHEAILGLIRHYKLQSILLTSPVGGGENAAETFANLGNIDSAPENPVSVNPKPVAVPAQDITGLDSSSAPSFDTSLAAGSATEDSESQDSFGEVALTDAPPFVPGGAQPRSTPPNTAAAVSGPEITILIDDKTPGAEKRVIVIPHASPWMMELLTGETADGAPSATTVALRPVSGGRTKKAADRTRSDRVLTRAL